MTVTSIQFKLLDVYVEPYLKILLQIIQPFRSNKLFFKSTIIQK